jgi:hypothetical protein
MLLRISLGVDGQARVSWSPLKNVKLDKSVKFMKLSKLSKLNYFLFALDNSIVGAATEK